MYTEVSTGDTGARARLISHVLPIKTKCVTFYYHMRGSDIGSLNVYLKGNTSRSIVKIWALSTEQGNGWLQGQAPINVTGDEVIRVRYSVVIITNKRTKKFIVNPHDKKVMFFQTIQSINFINTCFR
jgi:hypothetical protein